MGLFGRRAFVATGWVGGVLKKGQWFGVNGDGGGHRHRYVFEQAGGHGHRNVLEQGGGFRRFDLLDPCFWIYFLGIRDFKVTIKWKRKEYIFQRLRVFIFESSSDRKISICFSENIFFPAMAKSLFRSFVCVYMPSD